MNLNKLRLVGAIVNYFNHILTIHLPFKVYQLCGCLYENLNVIIHHLLLLKYLFDVNILSNY